MDAQAREVEKNNWTEQYKLLLSSAGTEPLPRLKKHIEYLEEYILRFLGFCRLETLAPEKLIDNSLFLVVEAASAVTAEDVRRFVDPGRVIWHAWKDYDEALSAARRNPRRIKIDAENIYVKFQTFAKLTCKCATEATKK